METEIEFLRSAKSLIQLKIVLDQLVDLLGRSLSTRDHEKICSINTE